MTPAEWLAVNVAAIERAQGGCPTLGGLPGTFRVAIAGDDIAVEMQATDGQWLPLDGPDERSATWLGDASQVIVAGIGLGHALDAADAGRLAKVVAIEPNPGLATLFLSRHDWRPWFESGRLRLLTGPDFRGAADSARFLDGLADVAVVTPPRRARLDPRAAAVATAVAERVAGNARANGEARRRFAGPYLLQTLANLPALGREAAIDDLDGSGAGVPAIVVGAGPSLDRNLRDLARHQDHGILIAADTALRPLALAGVRPHLVVAADPSALNARHLTAVDDTRDVMLAAEASVHPSGLEAFAGRTFFFRVSQHEPWPWLATGGLARGELRTWGSVLTSAFSLARRLGCNPIVFAGADLAFTEGRPYCRGTIYDAMWDEWIARGCTWEQLRLDYLSRQPEVWFDDVHGHRTRTAPHLKAFRDWLIDEAGRAGEITCLNATGDGILHGNAVRPCTWNEALGTAAAVPGVRDTLRRRHAAGTRRRDDRRLRRLIAQARARPATVPVSRWQAFTAGTVSAADIADALAAYRDERPT